MVNPRSGYLVDRSGVIRLATTDPASNTVYLSRALYGDMLYRVLIHEIGHCAILSFNLLDDIHAMVYPEYWVAAEEWVCNFIADYGLKIFSAAYHILGNKAIEYVPYELELLMA